VGVRLGRGAQYKTQSSTLVRAGGQHWQYALLGARIICDAEVEIDYADLLERCPDGHLSDTVQPQSGDANSEPPFAWRIAAEVPARPSTSAPTSGSVSTSACQRRHYRRGIDCRRGPSSPLTSRLTALSPVTLHASSDTWTSEIQPWFADFRGKIIVLLFWYPLAGVTYQFLHYHPGCVGSAMTRIH